MANKFIIQVQAKGFEQLQAQLKRSDGAMKNYGDSSQRAGKQTNAFRKQIALARNNLLLYTFAITGASRVFGTFIKRASDTRESISQFKQVFGDQADAAMDFADTLTTAFGQSKSDVVSLMASLQDTFVPLGFSRKEASKLSGALTQLSFDVASFKNASSPEVSNAFTSAIVGNHEAVRRFGIVITEARVKQKALEMGTFSGSGAMSAQAKVLARTQLIIEGSNDAIGDFERTQHEFANQVRILQNEFKDLSIEIGNALIPVAKVMMHFASVTHLKAYAVALGGIGVAYGVVNRQAILAAISTVKFRTALIKSGLGIAVLAFGELASRIGSTDKETKKLNKDLIDLQNDLDSLGDEDSKGVSFFKIIERHIGKTATKVTAFDLALQRVQAKIQKQKDLAADLDESMLGFDKAEEQMNFINDMLDDQQTKLISQEELSATIASNNSARFRKEQDDMLKRANALKGFSDQLGRAVVEGQALGPAVVNSVKAIAAELVAQAASLAFLNLLTGGGVSASKAGFGLLDAITGHTGGLITNNGVQKFANGGMVSGGDNVPILAQSGEFIMNREATQRVGLDNLRDMNSGGTSSPTINVSIQGGIVQDDYVRNTLIPALNKQGVSLA